MDALQKCLARMDEAFKQIAQGARKSPQGREEMERCLSQFESASQEALGHLEGMRSEEIGGNAAKGNADAQESAKLAEELAMKRYLVSQTKEVLGQWDQRLEATMEEKQAILDNV